MVTYNKLHATAHHGQCSNENHAELSISLDAEVSIRQGRGGVSTFGAAYCEPAPWKAASEGSV